MQRINLLAATAIALAVASGAASGARAQQIKPYFLVIVDTSGSMAWCAAGTQNTLGQNDCSCHTGNNCNNAFSTNRCGFPTNKIGNAKCSLQRIIDSSGGDAVFGLMQFEHVCNGTANDCGNSCSSNTNCDDGQLVVEMEDSNTTLMRQWVDGVTNGQGTCSPPHGFVHELTTGQWTPLAK